MFNNLKNSSEKTKKIITWSVSLGVTLVIFILWILFSLPNILGKSDESAQKAAESPSVFRVIKEQISEVPNDVLNILENWDTTIDSGDLLDSKIEYKAEN